MPKLKIDDDELDIKELEEAEYQEGGDFQKYDGEIPDTGTMLLFRVTKAWWTYSANDDPMLKVLCVAEDNPGSLEEYDGLPAWENMVLTANAKFKWAPFLEHFGLTIRQVKQNTIIASEDDNQGAPIEKIGKWVVGSDDAMFVGVVSKERYQGKWQAHISEWLDDDTPLEEEEKPEEKPARRQAKPASKPAASRSRRKPEPEPEEDEPEDEPEEGEEEPPTRRRSPNRSGAARGSTGRAKASPRGGRSRRQSAQDVPDDDEPPF